MKLYSHYHLGHSLLVSLALSLGGCTVDIPDFDTAIFACEVDADCADEYVCVQDVDGTKACAPASNPGIACDGPGEVFSAEDQACEVQDCGEPATIANGQYVYDSTAYGAEAVVECALGFIDEDATPLLCGEDGQWEGELASCEAIECVELADPDNGSFVYPTSGYGDEATLECNPGYEVNGPGVLVCNEEAQWYGEVSTCQIVDCGPPPSVANSESTVTATTYGGTVTYTCIDGFEFSDGQSGTLTCDEDKTWVGNTVLCVPTATCGNGVVETGEVCDGGADASDAYQPFGNQVCNTTCDGYAPYCGDNVTNGDETCDDGNIETETCAYGFQSCEVCSAGCRLSEGATSFCGDGITDADNGEVCDDGAENSDDWSPTPRCNAICSGDGPHCGDEQLQSASEACEDGNREDGDGCSASCQEIEPICGNGITEPGESCDDGDQLDNECSADCSEVLTQDCAGTWGGDAMVDICGVCGGDNLSCYIPGTACFEGLVFGENCQPVPPSSVDTCYDNSGEIACPGTPGPGVSTCDATSFCGQEAQYPSRLQRAWTCFDADGTSQPSCSADSTPGQMVFDPITGLMWQRNPGLLERSQPSARSHCEDLEYGTFGDWRLPSVRELRTLVDLGAFDPAIDSTAFPSVDGANLWSKSEDPVYVANGFRVWMRNGSVSRTLKTNEYATLCVRGFLGDPRAPLTASILNGAEVAEDPSTGLMWRLDVALGNDWAQALSHCEGLTDGGAGDWRLPTQNEFETIVEREAANPSLLPGIEDAQFWSSTTLHGEPDSAWRMNVDAAASYNGSKEEIHAALCVRSMLQKTNNGTVLEPGRRLRWLQCPLGMSLNDAGSCTGEATAFAYCESDDHACNGGTAGSVLASGPLFDACAGLAYEGFTDWRVPTKTELRGLLLCSNGYNTVESGNGCGTGAGAFSQPTIDTSVFSGFLSTAVMSSTSAMSSTDAYYVDFFLGSTAIGNKTFARAGLCVRDEN